MSYSSKPSDSSSPIAKDKDPHNYRKVGYTMILISVSLVLIGLLVLAIGDNYHFASDIMAKQEIDAMTPKHGYAVVVFDYTQPIGAKLKFLASANNFEDATKLKTQHTQEYLSQIGQVIIFDTSIVNNTNSISLAEVYGMTPTNGYNIVSFNTVMPVGARLSGQKLDLSPDEVVNDSKKYSDANVDKQVLILTFTSSFEDNLNQILGSKYDPTLISKNINHIKSMPQKLAPPKPQTSMISNIVNQTNSTILASSSVGNVVSNVTVSSHVSNLTNTNNTGSHNKSISLSDSLGIQAK